MSGNKLRILCLHGYTQNAAMFRKRTSAMRKSLDHLAEFVYITAPHHVGPPKISNQEVLTKYDVSEGHKPYGWWYAPKHKPTRNGYLIGYKESINYVQQVLDKQGPFDGILGFSQGASFAAILTELLEKSSPGFDHHAPFKFSVIVSGFKPTMQEATNSMLTKEHKLKTPSLHYIGDLDTLVLPEKMFLLTEVFENPVIFHHSGGYESPTSQQLQQQQAQQPQSQSNQAQDANQQQAQPQPLLTGPNLAIYSPAAMQPLSVLAAAQRKDQDPSAALAAVASAAAAAAPVELGAHGKPKRKQVKNACVNCQKACKKCDIGRPCQRCIKYGITDTCVNSVRKERKKGIKRGPYKKRNKTGAESGASSGTSTPNMTSPMTSAPMYVNGVRPAAIPIHYQPFPPGHYDPYAAYTGNGQMMPQAYMVPASIQQMYPTNPPVMSYQAAMNIISPQHQQQSLPQQQQQQQQQQPQQQSQQQQQPQTQQQQHSLAEQQQVNTQQQQALSVTNSPAPSSATPNSTAAVPAATAPAVETKPEDDDDEGSKLTILSRLCSAVLDRNDVPKQEPDVKIEGNQESTPPPSRPQSAT
ncbi:hypothetical protein G6F64_005388 [Rhizopus arrhizus]|uniref:Zn(2)-C6 fungal-type domain-containing protein n=1 Tax=Rhizopus oryzae TaxID=64495 RepID=A0A9P6XAP6_RHIOR|nr:hypothetical protein G6F64_005388 [Rhizopus arrhizus]